MIKTTEKVGVNMDITGKKVAFLGDSITAGAGASAYENCYVGRFERAYPQTKIYNYGVSGSRIARQSVINPNSAQDRDFNMRALEMEEGMDLVVVFGGTNDFGHGDAPLGAFGDKGVETFYGAVYSLYETLLNKYPEAQFVVITPLHRYRATEPTVSLQGATFEQYVQAIRETAELFSFPVLDLYATVGINPRFEIIRERMMPDGLHPNDCGYQRLFERIDAFIKNNL